MLRLVSNSSYLNLPSSQNYMHMPLKGAGLKGSMRLGWECLKSAWTILTRFFLQQQNPKCYFFKIYLSLKTNFNGLNPKYYKEGRREKREGEERRGHMKGKRGRVEKREGKRKGERRKVERQGQGKERE